MTITIHNLHGKVACNDVNLEVDLRWQLLEIEFWNQMKSSCADEFIGFTRMGILYRERENVAKSKLRCLNMLKK